MDWFEDAFFDEPERDSVDGGTTNLGPLWHGVSPRWGHSMHTMCSYHGMFPAKLVHYFIQQFSKPGGLVLDPFSGRGTVPLQARVEGRRSLSNDLNPLAYVLTRAKADPPSWVAMNRFVSEIERHYQSHGQPEPDVPPDIRMLFHPNTLRQITFLRDRLLRREIVDWSPEELMLAGALAGILHGSHRRDGTSRCLSISMPNTFSMSPTYVKNFIRDNKLNAPDQDVFECVRDKLARLYLDSFEGPSGQSFKEDASSLLAGKIIKPGTVDLLITSPPYLRVVNYGTANWIRLWWLGIEEVGRQRGAGRRSLDAALDHQHTYNSYRTFFVRMLKGMRRVLHKDGVAVLVIGDVANPGEAPLPLARQLWDDVGDESGLRLLDLIEDHLAVQNKVSRIWGDTKGRATDRDCVLVLARDDGDPVRATDVVEWDEPYKDGGPDAAHARLRDLRHAS
ncbi:MAG: DNA methyltransferase [Actinomycetota bacterium]|nr:DNA methyltransferase [Actinomycetota bacterium]